jgi:PKD repeat protein
VIAQDKNGSNSSWSTSLTVTISEQNTSNELPILEIKATNNVSTNQTIVFDASGSIDPDGVIISNVWDFGDGTTGSGQTLNHTYIQPGIYQVTLAVTDNTGHTYTKTIQVTIGANAEAPINAPSSSFPSLTIALICIVCAVSIVTVFFFRKNIRDVFLSTSTTHHMQKIEQLNAKKTQLTQNFSTKSNDNKTMSTEQKYMGSYDPSFEKKVDSTFTSSIEEKIDNM